MEMLKYSTSIAFSYFPLSGAWYGNVTHSACVSLHVKDWLQH